MFLYGSEGFGLAVADRTFKMVITWSGHIEIGGNTPSNE